MHREGLTKVGIWHLGVRNMLIWRQPFVEPGAGQTFVSGHATIAVQVMPPSGWALRADVLWRGEVGALPTGNGAHSPLVRRSSRRNRVDP